MFLYQDSYGEASARTETKREKSKKQKDDKSEENFNQGELLL